MPTETKSSRPSPLPIQPSSKNDISFTRLITTSVGIRLFIDTGVQFFNPFLPIIAAGMRVDAVTLGRLIAIRSLVGLVTPIIGSLADRYGFRLIMRLCLLVGGAGAAITGMSSTILTAAIGMVVWGIGIAGFSPTIQAYISSRLPYSKRARGIGILEYSWALAGIVGLFATGYLIEYVDSLGYAGWRAPFFIFAISMWISAIIIGTFPPASSHTTGASTTLANTDQQTSKEQYQAQSSIASSKRPAHFFNLGPSARSTYATIIGVMFLYFGAMQLLITHGLWLRTEYGLQAIQLGTVAFILGFADLCGSGLVSLLTDRIGKKRSVLFGTIGMLVGLLLMPYLNASLAVAIGGLWFTRGCFEFAIVSSIPLLSEQTPEQRGKVMTLGAAANLLGATVASVTGPWLYLAKGVVGFTSASAFFAVLAISIIWPYVKEE